MKSLNKEEEEMKNKGTIHIMRRYTRGSNRKQEINLSSLYIL